MLTITGLLQISQSIDQIQMFVVASPQSASSPVLALVSEPETGQVAAPGAEEEAVLVVRVVRPGPVIADVAALLIVSTGLVTRHQTGH